MPRPIPRELLESVTYNPETGIMMWTIPRLNRVCNEPITTLRHGYLTLCYNGFDYFQHRVAWVLHFGEPPNGLEIDHRNRIKDDNRLANLRLGTHKQNMWNRNGASNNTSGFRGVVYHRGKFAARVTLPNGALKHLGYFNTPQEASTVYETVASAIRGEYHNPYPCSKS